MLRVVRINLLGFHVFLLALCFAACGVRVGNPKQSGTGEDQQTKRTEENPEPENKEGSEKSGGPSEMPDSGPKSGPESGTNGPVNLPGQGMASVSPSPTPTVTPHAQ